MTNICVMIKLILLSLSLAYFRPSLADYPNYSTSRSCSAESDNHTTPAFKTNLNSLLSILEKEGPRNYGFYKTIIGEKSDMIYGLVQCRGDVSAQDCTACIKDAINETLTACKNSDNGGLWFRWCYLRYSTTDFFGQLNGVSMSTTFDNSSTDGPKVTAKRRILMSQLTAEVPNHPFMFKTGSVSVGQNETRYGLVQCNRDLNKSTCQDCVTTILSHFTQAIDNLSSYFVISNGCIMTYDQYQFYFNYTLPETNEGSGSAPTSALHSGLHIILVTITAAFLSLLIPKTMF